MTDLDELKRLLAAATPGPWHLNPDDDERIEAEGHERVIYGDLLDISEADAALIVAAVNAAPHLIAEIERLRENNWSLKLQWELDHLRETDRHQRGRIERLEAALQEIDDDPETPLWIHHRARAARESEK